MTQETDKMSSAQEAQVLRLIEPLIRYPGDFRMLEAMLRVRDEAARREWRNEQTDKMLAETLGEAAPPDDERAELVERLLAMQHMDPCYPTPHPLCVEAAARIAEVTGQRDKWADAALAADKRAEAAGAREKGLRQALEKIAGRTGEYSMPRPDAQPCYAGFAVVTARRALDGDDAAQKEPSNG